MASNRMNYSAQKAVVDQFLRNARDEREGKFGSLEKDAVMATLDAIRHQAFGLMAYAEHVAQFADVNSDDAHTALTDLYNEVQAVTFLCPKCNDRHAWITPCRMLWSR